MNSLNLQEISLTYKEFPEPTMNSLNLQEIPWMYKEFP